VLRRGRDGRALAALLTAAALGVEALGARVQRHRVDALARLLRVERLRQRRDLRHAVLVLEERLRDVVREVVRHVLADHQEVRDADRLGLGDALVVALLELGLDVRVAPPLAHLGQVAVEGHHADVVRRREVGHRARRHAAGPGEGVDGAVAQRGHGLPDAEAGEADVLVGVQPGDLEQALAEDLRAGVRGADRQRLALQVLDGLDPRVRGHDDVREREVDLRERAQLQRPLERLPPAHGVDGGVGERERDVGVALRDEEQVVHGGRCRLRGRRRVGQLVGQQVGERAAVHLVHAARATGGDREAARAAGRVVGRTCGRDRCRRERHPCQGEPPHGRAVYPREVPCKRTCATCDRGSMGDTGRVPRSMWTGAISFGLVTVPVKLYSAVSRKSVRFHQLNGKTGVRIQQRRVDPSTGDEVAYEDIVKGYELAPDRYVVIEGEELEALDPRKTRTIEIEEFVELSQVDPIYFDHPYYLAPGAGGAKPYRLLLDAMRETGKIAIAKVVIRSKEQLVAIRPMGDVLAMSTMVFADEVIDPASIDDVPGPDDVEVRDREVAIAKQLVESLAGDFEPERFRDTYREEVLALIERKAAGEDIAVQPARDEAAAPVPDLMAALRASLDAVRKGDEDEAPKAKPKVKRTSTAAKKPAKRKSTARS
jgi:DNA end-binding protein Ku